MKGTCFLFRLNKKAQKRHRPLQEQGTMPEGYVKNNLDLLYHEKIKLSIAKAKG